jgi:hypothetical protein
MWYYIFFIGEEEENFNANSQDSLLPNASLLFSPLMSQDTS